MPYSTMFENAALLVPGAVELHALQVYMLGLDSHTTITSNYNFWSLCDMHPKMLLLHTHGTSLFQAYYLGYQF